MVVVVFVSFQVLSNMIRIPDKNITGRLILCKIQYAPNFDTDDQSVICSFLIPKSASLLGNPPVERQDGRVGTAVEQLSEYATYNIFYQYELSLLPHLIYSLVHIYFLSVRALVVAALDLNPGTF